MGAGAQYHSRLDPKRTRHGVTLSGDIVESIRCYLTGKKREDGRFGINRYLIGDKHGLTRKVYNAKVHIHRKNEPALFLGIQDSEMDGFEAIQVDEVAD